MPNLNRFIKAQQGHISFPSYAKAYKEIAKGKKQDHWIWYIFPQLKTLGYSDTAKHFGIADFKEACEYLKNEMLFNNYCAIAQLVMNQLDTIPVNTLMGGGLDANKLASSITLFRAAAAFLAQQDTTSNDYAEIVSCCDQIFTKIKLQGYYPCQKTLTIITPFITTEVHQSATETNQHEAPRQAIKHTFFPSSNMPTHSPDFSNLSNALSNYIEQRDNEWGFHYNFLGIMSVVYWLQDALTGSNHFNNKSRDIKISAAMQLKHIIDNQDSESYSLLDTEKEALNEGRLGKIVNAHRGVSSIIRSIENKPSVNQIP